MTATATRERPTFTPGSIERTIARVERLLDAETAALRTRAPFDLRESSNGKSQALLEFSLAIRGLQGGAIEPELAARLKSLREKLEINRRVLRMHLEAVREITDIVAGTIRDSEWDGTYSQHIETGGYGP
jgi:hypothetical protein